MIESNYLDGKNNLLDKIKTIPAFSAFADTRLGEMLSLSKLRKYSPGEVIIKEGVIDSWIYFLLSGQVRVSKEGAEITRLVSYGDMFGEMGALDCTERSATVSAISDVMCLSMDASILDRVDYDDRHAFYAVLYRFIAGIMADRLRKTNEELSRCKSELAQGYKKFQSPKFD